MMYDASNLNGIKIGLNSYALLTRTTVETVNTWKSLYLCIELMNYSQMEEDYTEPYIKCKLQKELVTVLKSLLLNLFLKYEYC